MERFVALDVEIARRAPVVICAIGVVRIEQGRETACLRSLVHVAGPVRFTHIHGLRRSDLATAPTWPAVWRQVMDVIGDIRTVVAYRASFDRGALLATSAAHGVRLPRLRFVCAAAIFEDRSGTRGSLREALDSFGLTFPVQPHDPLADARAAALLVLACRRTAG